MAVKQVGSLKPLSQNRHTKLNNSLFTISTKAKEIRAGITVPNFSLTAKNGIWTVAELSVLLIALNSEEGETSCLEDGERKNKTQALDLKPGHQANRHSPYWLPPLVLQHCHVWRCLQQDFSHCKTRQKSGTRPCTRGATQLEAKNATSCKLLTELLETSYNGAKTRILG